jgi:hypothetical protein
MATIKVEHKSQLSKKDTFDKVQHFFKENESIKKMDAHLQYDVDEANCHIKLKGTHFSGEVQVTGDNPSVVVISVNLGFLASAFKGKVQETLERKMGQLLG